MAVYTITIQELVKAGYQIFDDTWTTFDPEHKQELCQKILRHYWFYEIGQETPDRFRHYINTHLSELMPYYNQLYASELLKLEPLYDSVMSMEKDEDGSRKRDTVTANQTTLDRLKTIAGDIRSLTKNQTLGTENMTDNQNAKTNRQKDWTENWTETWEVDTHTDSHTHEEEGKDTTGKETTDQSVDTDHTQTLNYTRGDTTDRTDTVNVTSKEGQNETAKTTDKLDKTESTTAHKDTKDVTDQTASNTRRYSDTPQKQIGQNDLAINESYLTNYTRDNSTQDTTTTGSEDLTSSTITGQNDTTDVTKKLDIDKTQDTNETEKTTLDRKDTTNDTQKTGETTDKVVDTTENMDRTADTDTTTDTREDGKRQRGTVGAETEAITSTQDEVRYTTAKTDFNGDTQQLSAENEREGASQTNAGSTLENDLNKIKTLMTYKGTKTSQATLLLEYRKTFLNIDMMIIEDLASDFMGVF